MTKIVKIGALLFIAVIILGSCAQNNDFYGGVLLDSEKMSEIRYFEVLQSRADISAENTERCLRIKKRSRPK